MKNITAIIQARMGSTRLPGKVMKPLAGLPMIHHVVERTRRIDSVTQVIVATSTSQREEPLVEYLTTLNDVEIFRGSEDDVLSRYFNAAKTYEADIVLRITGDCPLLSPKVSSRVVRAFLKNEESFDYATNTLSRTFPRGLDTSVMPFEILEQAHRQATTPSEREHVTVYIWSNPEKFRLLSIEDNQDRHHLRWTVDTTEDFELISQLYDGLYFSNPHFDYEEILEYLERFPELSELNASIRQKPL